MYLHWFKESETSLSCQSGLKAASIINWCHGTHELYNTSKVMGWSGIKVHIQTHLELSFIPGCLESSFILTHTDGNCISDQKW